MQKKNLFKKVQRDKRQKTRESSEPVEEPKDKEEEELSQEMIQKIMIIVPKQGMNVEALQTKYPIIDWEIYTEGARKYWKIIRVGISTEGAVGLAESTKEDALGLKPPQQ
ncbi:hypothetical protein Tco_1380782, partial [Tanacetum coccineum]